MSNLKTWVGNTESRTDTITATPIELMAATVDISIPRPSVGTPLPPMWHWLYFLPKSPTSALGLDGHPARGGFLPPVAKQRRMFAGGSTKFLEPLFVGQSIKRSSEIISVKETTGRSGPLTLVEIQNDIRSEGELALQEQQTIVYTDASPAARETKAKNSIPRTRWESEILTSPALLFRFSALTFNAHRIHYDYEYATSVERYPGLVVQGPLVALLLIGLATSNKIGNIDRFSFRARSPFFVREKVHLRGQPNATGVQLAAYSEHGVLGMDASIEAVT